MPTFPSTLPNPSQRYSASADPSLSTTRFEIGLRQRSRFSHTVERVQVEWLLNQLQLDILEKFIERDLVQGSQSFNITLAGLDGLRQVEAQIVEGRIQKSYVAHANWRVGATLHIEPPVRMDDDTYEILLMSELFDPDLFVLASSAIYNYLELVYGDSDGDPLVRQFMNLNT